MRTKMVHDRERAPLPELREHIRRIERPTAQPMGYCVWRRRDRPGAAERRLARGALHEILGQAATRRMAHSLPPLPPASSDDSQPRGAWG